MTFPYLTGLPDGRRIRDPQIEGAEWLDNRAMCGDKVGTGKTLQAIAWLDKVKARTAIVVCKQEQMYSTFAEDIVTWTDHRSPFVLGSMSKKERNILLKAIRNLPEYVIIINYESWRDDRQFLYDLADLAVDAIIFDESHEIIKRSTQAFRGIETLIFNPRCDVCNRRVFGHLSTAYPCQCGRTMNYLFGRDWAYSIPNVLTMSASFVLNNPTDIFAQLNLINRARFANESTFISEYCHKNYYTGRWEWKSNRKRDNLFLTLGRQYLARTKAEVGIKEWALPPRYLKMSLNPRYHPKQYEAYKFLKERSALQLEDMLGNAEKVGVVSVLAVYTRLKQMLEWPEGIEIKDPDSKEVIYRCNVRESVKADAAFNLIEDSIRAGERVVGFGMYKALLYELQRRLEKAGYRAGVFCSDTPAKERALIKRDFDRQLLKREKIEPTYNAVLAIYRKGGVGLDFTAATHEIDFGREWNYGREEQGTGRLDRFGQEEYVTRTILQVQNSVDMWMHDIVEDKREMAHDLDTAARLARSLLEELRRE